MRSPAGRIVLLAIAIAMFAIAASVAQFRIIPIVVAIACVMLLASSLSRAGQLSQVLRAFENRPVAIRVWGEPLNGPDCRIVSIRAIGAGLHLFIRCGDSPPVDLKIAQPRDAQIAATSAEIREAAYVQWARAKLPRVAGTPAVVLELR